MARLQRSDAAAPIDRFPELSSREYADDNSGDFGTGEAGGRKDRMNKYVALLRGINVGGYRLIKMQDLVSIFSDAGCKNVRTFQQAGNVIFDSRSANAKSLTKKIEGALEKDLGYHVPVVLRSLPELKKIVESDPFEGFVDSKDVMLLAVVFL